MTLFILARSGIFACALTTVGLPALAQADAIHEPTQEPCDTQLIVVADAAGTAEGSSGDPGDVTERAVPRLAPGMPPGGAAAPQIEGGLFDGKRLRARPGYHFEQPQPGGVALLKPNSGGAGVKLSCRCMKGKGACIMTIEGGNSAYCSPNGCAGDCEMRLTTGVMSPGIRMQ